ncbi:MAG: tagaturonate reductase [Clostridia bacterium]|nr:tagaturonate reductase [Clostridia bacterium]
MNKTVRPEKVIQFGEGGFLRGFVDWMLDIANEKTDFNGSVVVVQPIKNGLCDLLSAQDCVYTHFCRGVEGVDVKKIDVISRCVKPYDDFDAYMALAENPDFRFIVSNTTEAGIAFSAEDKITDRPADTFPGKLTQLLFKRYETGLDGFVLLPCELIDKNGAQLKACVLKYAELWGLGEGFADWIENKNIFCNTLVDRINTGYPKGESLDLDFDDKMVNTSEYFHLWVIDGYEGLFNELPFDKCGLNVIVTKELERYRTRKVRILNGSHTSMIPYALLCGVETVGECLKNDVISAHLKACQAEIVDSLDMNREEALEYADSVMTRFANPYIQHKCQSIALNSVSKFKVRVLPSILEYEKKFGKTPSTLMFSFAKLIDFYKKGTPDDAEEVIRKLKTGTVAEILADSTLWGQDLSKYADEVSKYADSSK